MGVINWLFNRQSKMITVELPMPLVYALETVTYMQNNARSEDDQVTRDDIVVLALVEYMQKNLWTNVVDDIRVVTQVHRQEVPYREDNVRTLPSLNRQNHNWR